MKIRKLLSVILSVLLIFSSIPTVFAIADASSLNRKMLYFSLINSNDLYQTFNVTKGSTYNFSFYLSNSISGFEVVSKTVDSRSTIGIDVNLISKEDFGSYFLYNYEVTYPDDLTTNSSFLGLNFPAGSEGFAFDFLVSLKGDTSNTQLFSNGDFSRTLDYWALGWDAWFAIYNSSNQTEWSNKFSTLKIYDYDENLIDSYEYKFSNKMLYFENIQKYENFASQIKCIPGKEYILSFSANTTNPLTPVALSNGDLKQIEINETLLEKVEYDNYSSYTFKFSIPTNYNDSYNLIFIGFNIPSYTIGYIFDAECYLSEDILQMNLWSNSNFKTGLNDWIWGSDVWFNSPFDNSNSNLYQWSNDMSYLELNNIDVDKITIQMPECFYRIIDGTVKIIRYNYEPNGDFIIPETIEGLPVTSIGEFAFNTFSEVTSISIPKGVTDINIGAFDACTKLENIFVDSENSYYCSIDGVLYNKDATFLLKYPSNKANFYFNISSELSSIDDKAFFCCKNLAYFTVSEDNEFFSVIDGVLYDKEELTLIKYPPVHTSSYLEISKYVLSINETAFENCKNLAEVIVNKNNKNFCSIDGVLYNIIEYQDTYLYDLTLYPSQKTDKHFIVPSYIRSIDPYAFKNNKFLESITVYDSLSVVWDYAFYGCDNLKKVYFCGNENGWKDISVKSENINFTSAEFINHSAHTYSSEFTVEIEPTLFESGIKSQHCLYCEDSINSTIVPPLETVASGNCGANAYWGIAQDGTLVISGYGATYDYGTASAVPWFRYADVITKIIIQERINYIGHYSFYACSNLLSVECDYYNITFSNYYVFNDDNDIVFYGQKGGNLENYTTDNGYILLEKPSIKFINKNNVTLTYYDGYEYSCDGINWQKSNVFNNLSYDTLYEFSRRVIDDDKSEPIFMTRFILAGKPEFSLIGSTKVLIKAYPDSEYSLDGINWSTNIKLGNLIPNFNYTIYKRYNFENTYCVTSEATEIITNGSDDLNINPQAKDLVALKKGLMNQDKNMAFDYNNDGEINILDVIRLKKYLSGENVTLGKQYISENGVLHLSNKSLKVGDTLTVTITLDAGEPIYAISCVVKYDNSILEYKSGSAYGSNGTLKIIESPSGETKVSYSLTFSAIAAGSSAVSVSDCNYSTMGDNGAVDKYFSNSCDSINILVS